MINSFKEGDVVCYHNEPVKRYFIVIVNRDDLVILYDLFFCEFRDFTFITEIIKSLEKL